jgi:Caspase domain
MSRNSGGSPRAQPRVVVEWMHAALVLAALVVTTPTWATKIALLVGVTEYPDLPPSLQLKAPANDVRLMRTVLRQRGFDDANIETLADGVDGAIAPTRAAILDALARTAQRARPGDTVYLHFSGHGSLQVVADTPAAAATPVRRWQPIFLPRDVRGWDGKSGEAVPKAITDTVMREAVDAINDRGAFVFAVFDACHSARLVRGILPDTDPSLVRVRQVEPATLSATQAPLPAIDVRPPWFEAASPSPTSPTTPRDRGRAVYFYAAQSYEMATSLPLPVGDRKAWHGLFTWHLARALALGEAPSHRQLGQHLLSRYDQWPAASALPLFGGDGLDDAVFGQATVPVRQWPLERHGTRAALPAGALTGLGEGALVALLSDPLVTPGRDVTKPLPGTLGYARVSSLEVDRAWLEPVAWQGFAAPSMALMQAGTWARLMSNPAMFALRVLIDTSDCPTTCPAARAVAMLRRDGVPGVDVRWVDRADAADVRLRATARGVQVLLPGAIEGGRSSWGYAAPSSDDASGLETLARQTASALHRVARTRNLLELAARVALRPTRPGIRFDVTAIRRVGRAGGAEATVTSDRLFDLGRGDELTFGGTNTADDPHDLVAFWLGGDQSITRVYPTDRRDVPRLAAGESLRRARWRVANDSEGTERLLVITMPMRRGHEAADFRFLEQSPLGRLRGAVDADLQALLDACLADWRTRGDAAPAPPSELLSMQIYTFRIEAPR